MSWKRNRIKTNLTDFKTQPLQPLKRLSPSRYLSLKKCQLRGIYSSTGSLLLPRSPAAHIGTAIHDMLELSMKGRIQSVEDFNSAWDNIIRRIEMGMNDNPLERHHVPLSLNIFNFEVKKTLARKMISAHYSFFPRMGSEWGKIAETWVKTADGKIAGRIDLVDKTSEGIEITDYKTGKIFEDSGQVKEEYVVQLKMYAALYSETHGIWPDKLSLHGFDVGKVIVDFDKKECSNLIEDGKKMLRDITELIKAGVQADDFANPSPANCRFCLFRPACNKYWEAPKELGDWPLDANGCLKEKKVLLNSTFRITLQSDKGICVIRGLSQDRHSYLNDDVEEILLCNLKNDTIAGSYMENMLTTGYPVR